MKKNQASKQRENPGPSKSIRTEGEAKITTGDEGGPAIDSKENIETSDLHKYQFVDLMNIDESSHIKIDDNSSENNESNYSSKTNDNIEEEDKEISEGSLDHDSISERSNGTEESKSEPEENQSDQEGNNSDSEGNNSDSKESNSDSEESNSDSEENKSDQEESNSDSKESNSDSEESKSDPEESKSGSFENNINPLELKRQHLYLIFNHFQEFQNSSLEIIQKFLNSFNPENRENIKCKGFIKSLHELFIKHLDKKN